MTDDLYRKEALEHRHRSLYGDVILKSPPGTWVVTLILLTVMAILGGIFFFGKVQTGDEAIALWRWVLMKVN